MVTRGLLSCEIFACSRVTPASFSGVIFGSSEPSRDALLLSTNLLASLLNKREVVTAGLKFMSVGLMIGAKWPIKIAGFF